MFPCRSLAAVLGVLALCVATRADAAFNSRGGHLSQASCGSCHVTGDGVDPAQASRLVASQETLCARCHPRAMKASHPSGFVPVKRPPGDYPLDWKGDMTCSTCHLVHGSESGLLRGAKRARAFCLSCHDGSFFARMKDSGTSLVRSGHLNAGNARGTLDIDPQSLHCMSCHAGGHSVGGSVSVARNGVMRHSSGAAPHPIGHSYRDAAKSGNFHPEVVLAQKSIMLVDGRMSCLSCHEAYRQEHGKLVVPMTRSALCLACHAK